MKITHLILLAASLALASCAGLAGSSLTFDADGNAIVRAPLPLVIPTK
jgi:hypothetical protein